ncbi:hypothetical protein [Lyticum sinuosum]|uniref:Uncharacterized protein n=1 Tax=Lyticum sinuosum TaxID=1332059 RepID=A0AAE4VL09_9RICK|nr:hypothetical protein [Lyticum sinuosum]MDZ5761600.1 hypothetical protein [Lyticum sinuosum]
MQKELEIINNVNQEEELEIINNVNQQEELEIINNVNQEEELEIVKFNITNKIINNDKNKLYSTIFILYNISMELSERYINYTNYINCIKSNNNISDKKKFLKFLKDHNDITKKIKGYFEEITDTILNINKEQKKNNDDKNTDLLDDFIKRSKFFKKNNQQSQELQDLSKVQNTQELKELSEMMIKIAFYIENEFILEKFEVNIDRSSFYKKICKSLLKLKETLILKVLNKDTLIKLFLVFKSIFKTIKYATLVTFIPIITLGLIHYLNYSFVIILPSLLISRFIASALNKNLEIDFKFDNVFSQKFKFTDYINIIIGIADTIINTCTYQILKSIYDEFKEKYKRLHYAKFGEENDENVDKLFTFEPKVSKESTQKLRKCFKILKQRRCYKHDKSYSYHKLSSININCYNKVLMIT